MESSLYTLSAFHDQAGSCRAILDPVLYPKGIPEDLKSRSTVNDTVAAKYVQHRASPKELLPASFTTPTDARLVLAPLRERCTTLTDEQTALSNDALESLNAKAMAEFVMCRDDQLLNGIGLLATTIHDHYSENPDQYSEYLALEPEAQRQGMSLLNAI